MMNEHEQRDCKRKQELALNKELGACGERLASVFLAARGYRILSRNSRRRYLGEIDILAYRGRVLHVIEVKSGRSSYEELLSRLHVKKRRRLWRTLRSWLHSAASSIPPWNEIQLDLLLIQFHLPACCRLIYLSDQAPIEDLLQMHRLR